MPDFAVPDAWRLVEAASRAHGHLADALVLEFHPALQHVDELQLAVVQVPLAVRRLPGARADHVRDDLAAGGAPDAEVAVLEITAQAALPERGFFRMADMKTAAHGARILR